jgi:hypothetical protein
MPSANAPICELSGLAGNSVIVSGEQLLKKIKVISERQ